MTIAWNNELHIKWQYLMGLENTISEKYGDFWKNKMPIKSTSNLTRNVIYS
jgi:hypothetical protein